MHIRVGGLGGLFGVEHDSVTTSARLRQRADTDTYHSRDLLMGRTAEFGECGRGNLWQSCQARLNLPVSSDFYPGGPVPHTSLFENGRNRT